MQRRKFIKESSMIAIAVSVFGNVNGSKKEFIFDIPTTTDILGPFYRPEAPERVNITPSGFSGQTFHVSGTVYKQDGKTPFTNCRIEVWQCDENMLYDNISDDFRFRGRQQTGTDGKYHFICMHPIPYPDIIGENKSKMRPAHIHFLISRDGQQDLITQIYLEDDPFINEDNAASVPNAVKRILKITRNNKNEESIKFDIVMAKEFVPEDSVFEKLAGVYKMNDNSVMEFYRQGDLLFFKRNSQIRDGLSYKGNNTFSGGISDQTKVNFQVGDRDEVKVKMHFKTINNGEFDFEGIKILKYKNPVN
jgi:catechol 1,2-dioxygenase